MAPIAPVHSARCRLCAAEARWVGMQRILTKYDADYFQCPNCDLLQTEAPYWLRRLPGLRLRIWIPGPSRGTGSASA